MIAVVLALFACSFGDAEPEAPADDAPREVVLDPTALSLAGIVVVEVAEGQLPRTLEVPGTLALDPAAEARIGAPASGVVSRVLVRPGDRVAEGAVLAWVHSPEVADARAAWSSADARRGTALARRDRLRLLQSDGVSSKAELLEAEAELTDASGAADAAAARRRFYGVRAGDQGSDAPVRTPVGGTVLESMATVGAFVSPDVPLFHIGDADDLGLVLSVPDAALAAVNAGDAVQFTVEGADAPVYAGAVIALGRWVDPDSRAVEVRASVADPAHALRPNQYVRATLVLDSEDASTGVVLSRDAVQTLDGQSVVFVETAPGRFAPRAVEVSARVGDRVRLGEGVEPGTRVVTEGAFALKGQLVKGELGGDDD